MIVTGSAKAVASAVPDVRIALVTRCLDDADFGAYAFEKGGMKGKWLGDDWRTPFWERAARELKMTLDEAYEDDDAKMRAESLMTDEAMRIATGDDRRYDWSGGDRLLAGRIRPRRRSRYREDRRTARQHARSPHDITGE